MSAIYDTIGITYSRYRRPDARIAARIEHALGDAHSIVDVGSGVGSYEPRERRVVALEPSRTMIAQRPAGAAPIARGVAENLPFANGAFDAALAVLTVHHWRDPDAGLAELVRVARRVVVLTWDPQCFARFWLVAEYVPELIEHEAGLATLSAVKAALAVTDVHVVPIPWDCTDGFCGAYWRRPERYLDPAARAAISGLIRCDPGGLAHAMSQLERDLADGTWQSRHAELLGQSEMDLGYRLVVARGCTSRLQMRSNSPVNGRIPR